MNLDPWTVALSHFEPKYSTLVGVMEQGPITKAKVIKKRNKWCVTFTEVWKADSDGAYTLDIDSKTFDDYIEWADTELKKWNCIRLSWDTWQFASKVEAEKFVLIFALKWDQ